MHACDRLAGVPVEYNLRRYRRTLARCDAVRLDHEDDAALRARFEAIRLRASQRESLDALLPEAFAIVDEADFVLIDEARVPLVVAGETPSLAIDHQRIAGLVRTLTPGLHFRVDEYERNVALTDAGFACVEAELGCESRSSRRSRVCVPKGAESASSGRGCGDRRRPGRI